ncbi:MAG: hypothetical protein ACI4V2_08110, partial [Alloprevotella sp.]
KNKTTASGGFEPEKTGETVQPSSWPPRGRRYLPIKKNCVRCGFSVEKSKRQRAGESECGLKDQKHSALAESLPGFLPVFCL